MPGYCPSEGVPIWFMSHPHGNPPAVPMSIYTVVPWSTTLSTFNFTFNEANRLGCFKPPPFSMDLAGKRGRARFTCPSSLCQDTGLWCSFVGSRGLIAHCSRNPCQGVREPECASLGLAGRLLNMGFFHSGWTHSKGAHKAPALRSNTLSVASSQLMNTTLPCFRHTLYTAL